MHQRTNMLSTCTLLFYTALFSAFSSAAPPSAPQLPLQIHAKPSWGSLGNWLIAKVLPNYEDVESKVKTTPSGPYDELVLRFNVSSTAEATSLAEAANILFLDVWEYSEDWVDIRISQAVVPSLLGLLPSSLQHSHRPLMNPLELAKAISASYPSEKHDDEVNFHSGRRRGTFTAGLSSSRDEGANIFFEDYRPLSVIVPWMRLLESLFPTHIRVISVGTSYEGRDINAIRIGVHPTNSERPLGPRKTIIVSGGSHAREWISTSTVTYVAYSFITSYGKSNEVTKLLEDFDWVFIPTLNPDGYVYSWESDRLWRKNRQPTSLRFCRGLDLDRSWDFMWDGESTSGNPCSESFAGEEPFQAVESQRFAAWAQNETEHQISDFVGFIDLHSYSQQILYPYSYSCYDRPPTLEDLEELGEGLSKSIRLSHRQNYKVTSACEGNVAYSDSKGRVLLPRMENGGGSALDWFYHQLKVRHAFQIKLRDTGSYGFLLPKHYILPTGREILQALLYFGKSFNQQ